MVLVVLIEKLLGRVTNSSTEESRAVFEGIVNVIVTGAVGT